MQQVGHATVSLPSDDALGWHYWHEHWGLEIEESTTSQPATSSTAVPTAEVFGGEQQTELQPPTVRTRLPHGVGMQDTGASASAGPEQAIQGLIATVVRVDPGAQIFVNTESKSRPWFRFGSGSRGRALYRVVIRSTRKRKFLVFAMPSTPGSHVLNSCGDATPRDQRGYYRSG